MLVVGLTPELVMNAFTRRAERRLAKMQKGARAHDAEAAVAASKGNIAVDLNKVFFLFSSATNWQTLTKIN